MLKWYCDKTYTKMPETSTCEEFEIVAIEDYKEEFEILEKTYFSEPFWGKVVNKN